MGWRHLLLLKKKGQREIAKFTSKATQSWTELERWCVWKDKSSGTRFIVDAQVSPLITSLSRKWGLVQKKTSMFIRTPPWCKFYGWICESECGVVFLARRGLLFHSLQWLVWVKRTRMLPTVCGYSATPSPVPTASRPFKRTRAATTCSAPRWDVTPLA